MHGVSSMLCFHGQPAVRKDREHTFVFRKHLRHKSGQAFYPRDGSQVLQQDSGNPLTMVVFLDRKRHLRASQFAGLIDDHVAACPNDDFMLSFSGCDHQSDRVFEIKLGSRFEILFGQQFFVMEEARVDRFWIRFLAVTNLFLSSAGSTGPSPIAFESYGLVVFAASHDAGYPLSGRICSFVASGFEYLRLGFRFFSSDFVLRILNYWLFGWLC
jgi:hypothetical protein